MLEKDLETERSGVPMKPALIDRFNRFNMEVSEVMGVPQISQIQVMDDH